MTRPMSRPMTHAETTHEALTTRPGLRARAARRLPLARRVARRVAPWLAIGAGVVSLLRGVVELLAAWRAL